MPFKVINSINTGKEPENPEKFSPWLTNRFFSFFPDTIFHAQQMNLNYDLESYLQLSYLINSVRPSKRWTKWLKRTESPNYELIQNWYGFGDRKTKEALAVLTKDQIKEIREKAKSQEQ